MFASVAQGFLYRHVFKPVAFRFDPESVHDRMTNVGRWMGNHAFTRALAHAVWSYEHPALEQSLFGISFPNPVGLTAGFDKDGYLISILSEIGFGFAEIGSITGKPCAGNPKPRLWRLPKTKSLLVYYGLKNDGCEAVAERLRLANKRIPIGVSVAKTNCAETCEVQEGINDYVHAFRTAYPISDYVTINISCPNVFGGEPFTKPELLEQLLSSIDALEARKPIFLKMPADFSLTEMEALVNVALAHRVHGLIFSNLTKRRDRPEMRRDEPVPVPQGGLSGKPVFQASNQFLSHFYRHVGSRLVLIGTGGIFSANDAYEKILQGASLVQLATGMIFEGPQLIGQINRGMMRLLKRDGFNTINEAIGTKVNTL
jgi:dihydroorotate dehydrogenase subfamily 2